MNNPRPPRPRSIESSDYQPRMPVLALIPASWAERLAARGVDAGRLLRFAGVGGVCGLVQLVLFAGLTWANGHPVLANIGAFLLSAQVNFLLSERFTWGDRELLPGARPRAVRWLSFHLSIGMTFLLNQAAFLAARLAAPDLLASMLGIATAAVVNFAVLDRLTFRPAEDTNFSGK